MGVQLSKTFVCRTCAFNPHYMYQDPTRQDGDTTFKQSGNTQVCLLQRHRLENGTIVDSNQTASREYKIAQSLLFIGSQPEYYQVSEGEVCRVSNHDEKPQKILYRSERSIIFKGSRTPTDESCDFPEDARLFFQGKRIADIPEYDWICFSETSQPSLLELQASQTKRANRITKNLLTISRKLENIPDSQEAQRLLKTMLNIAGKFDLGKEIYPKENKRTFTLTPKKSSVIHNTFEIKENGKLVAFVFTKVPYLSKLIFNLVNVSVYRSRSQYEELGNESFKAASLMVLQTLMGNDFSKTFQLKMQKNFADCGNKSCGVVRYTTKKTEKNIQHTTVQVFDGQKTVNHKLAMNRHTLQFGNYEWSNTYKKVDGPGFCIRQTNAGDKRRINILGYDIKPFDVVQHDEYEITVDKTTWSDTNILIPVLFAYIMRSWNTVSVAGLIPYFVLIKDNLSLINILKTKNPKIRHIQP